MKDIQYNSANVRIRTYESQLLDQAFFDRLLNVEQASELYNILQETPYGDFIDESLTKHDFEKVLMAEQKRTFDLAYEITPLKAVVDIFTLRYDYQNLKVLVKNAYLQEDLEAYVVPLGSIDLAVLKEFVQVRHHALVPQIMVDCLTEVYAYIEDYKEIQGIDIIFDSYYWQHFLEVTQATNQSEFIELSQRLVDVYNLSVVLRSYLMGRKKGFMSAVLVEGGLLTKETLLAYLETSFEALLDYLVETDYGPLIMSTIDELQEHKTINQFDLLKDNFLMRYFKERKVIPFGPIPLLGYLNAKESEIKNLRMIFVGKINRIPTEKLRSRVRETYG